MRKVNVYTSMDLSIPGEANLVFHLDTTNEFGHIFCSKFGKAEEMIEALDEMLRWEKTNKNLITYETEILESFVVLNSSYLGPERTTAEYCGECLRDFNHGENVHYTWFKNNYFCYICYVEMNKKCDAIYLDWKLRKVDLK